MEKRGVIHEDLHPPICAIYKDSIHSYRIFYCAMEFDIFICYGFVSKELVSIYDI